MRIQQYDERQFLGLGKRKGYLTTEKIEKKLARTIHHLERNLSAAQAKMGRAQEEIDRIQAKLAEQRKTLKRVSS